MKSKHFLLFALLVLSLFSLFGSCSIEPEQYEVETTRREPSNCTLADDTKIKHGAQFVGYEESAVANGQTCKSKIQTCNDGIVTGGYRYSSCSVAASNACIFNGKIIESGNNTIAYSSETIDYSGQCSTISEPRSCDNGTLSGSFIYSTCTPKSPNDCYYKDPDNNSATILSGNSVVAYKYNSVAYNAQCSGFSDENDEARVCTNGILSGSFSYLVCSVRSQGNKASANLIIDNGTDNTTIFIQALNSGTAYNGYTFSVLGSTVDFSGNALTTSNPVDIQRSGSAYTMYVLSEVIEHQDIVNEINNYQTDFYARISSGISNNFSVPVENLRNGWTIYGGGNWIISSDNKTVDQTVNGSQFYFVSQDNRTNYVLRSTMRSTDSDDDDMGFVVGWANDENHILFRWDAADVNGGIRGGVRSLEYILNRSATVLAQESVRWTRNYTYQVLISYTDQNIQVEIDNSTVFNVSASQFSSISSFPTGKFGFYNLSQGGVTYGNVQTGVATVTSGGTAD
jgi:hypothetical protein